MSATATIPAWDVFGILPPIRPGSTGIARERSPYRATPLDLRRRFGHTPDRRRILQGFMALRAELAAAGLANGFQWINGSFTESDDDTDAIDWLARQDHDPATGGTSDEH